MSCWTFLGIEPTEDEGEIKRVYLEMLPFHHPEEDPDGFRQLRMAMEEALKEAQRRKREREAEENSEFCESEMMGRGEIQDFLKRAEEIYSDYERRICPQEWEGILSMPVCQDLESQREAGWAFLGFLMNHFHLPHSCYQAFNKTFGWLEDEDELYAHFPEGFVAYLYDRIQVEDTFRYDILKAPEGTDCDEFCEVFFTLRRAIGEKDRETVEETLKRMDEFGIEHPDLQVLRIRHEAMQRGHEQTAWEMARELFARDGDNSATCYWYVRTSMDYEDSDIEAEVLEKIIRTLLERDPECAGYWQILGDFMRRQGDLSQALACYQRSRDYVEEPWEYMEKQIADIARELSVQMEEDPDFDDWWQLAHVCWMGERYERVREILKEAEPKEEQRQPWLIMMAGSCHMLEDYEAAVKYRQQIWDLYEEKPRPLKLYLDLAEDYSLFGDTQRALEIYHDAEAVFPDEPEICYRQAQIMFNTGRQEEGLSFCNKALEQGFHTDSFHLKMEILLDLERFQEVRELAEDVQKQGYEGAQIRYYYARALRGLEENEQAERILKELAEQTGEAGVVCQEYAGLCYDMDRTEEALEWIEKALKQQDTPVRSYMKGRYLHDLKRYQEEEALYREMMEKGLDGYYIYYRMARALESMHRYEAAEAAFQCAVERDSTSGMAWDGLGDVLQEQGKWEKAAHAYEEGWKNGNFQAIRDLCRLMKRTNQNEKAIRYLEEGLKKQPDDGSLLWIYACVLRRQKKYEEAVRLLGRYMEVKPSQMSSAYREIALCWEKAKDFERARENYQKAIDHEPENARNWRVFGKYYAEEEKDLNKALPLLEKAVSLDEDSTYGWMKLGEVYEELGKNQKAQECYEKSLRNYQQELEDDPEDCCTYEGIADVLIHMGRLEEAEEMAKKAMSLQFSVFTCNGPACYESMEDMAKIEERRGDLEGALEWMEKAGEHSVTDYYPKEIARLREAIGTIAEAGNDLQC